MPIGLGPKHVDDPFRGLIDLIKMKVQTFDSDGKALKETPIPEELRDEADFARQAMLEELYNYSDEMTELALSEEAIPNELIRKVIRKATLAQMIQPVVCGSALHGIGVQGVLDSVKYYLPSPLDRPPVEGTNPRKEGLTEVRKPDPKEPFCGLVFKIQPERTGDFYWIRVYSGELTENTRVLCPGKDKKENVAQLWQIHAQKKERDGKVPSVSSGDIVGVIGPRFAVTGDTLCDSKAPILLEEIEFPETVIEMAIEPESTAERKKLGDTLEMLKRQDPTFQAVENEDTGQTLISGMGELHLEVIKNRLLRDFNLNVKVHKPRVSYRETVAQKVEVTGECHRLVAGQQLFAKLTLILEPDEQIEGVRILRGGIAAELPADMMEAVMEELQSRGQGGGVIGSFPLTGLKITLSGCEVNPEQSNAMAFSIAAGEAFEEALKKAIPVLLEPVMKLNITTPDDYYGDFVSDLAQRRARVVNTDSHAGMTFIEANAPLAELFGYAGAMRSLSQGRAGSSMEPLQYEPAPDSVKDSFAF